MSGYYQRARNCVRSSHIGTTVAKVKIEISLRSFARKNERCNSLEKVQQVDSSSQRENDPVKSSYCPFELCFRTVEIFGRMTFRRDTRALFDCRHGSRVGGKSEGERGRKRPCQSSLPAFLFLRNAASKSQTLALTTFLPAGSSQSKSG
jgi:hypothetical protein